MRTLLAVACTAVAASHCAPSHSSEGSPNTSPEGHMPHAELLAQKLWEDGYGDLFSSSQHEQTISRIWEAPGNRSGLEALIDDEKATVKARFVAAEVLFARDLTFVRRHDRRTIARIYGVALQRKLTGSLNIWGLLWYDDTAGSVGDRFSSLGDAAIPVLIELLEDRTVMRGYVGSEAATIGNAAKFRIRDFAAYYLSQILHQQLHLPTELPQNIDFATRDAAIERLVTDMKSK